MSIFDQQNKLFELTKQSYRNTKDILSMPAFEEDYTEAKFDNLQLELSALEARGRTLGEELRTVSQQTTQVRKQVEELCTELWGHDLEEGQCTQCGFIDDRDPDMDAEDWSGIRAGFETDK